MAAAGPGQSQSAAFIVPLNFPTVPKLPTEADWEQVRLDQLRAWDWAAENPAVLRKQGLEIALTTYALADKKKFRSNLRLALDRGLSESDALAALTTVPAKLCGSKSNLGPSSPAKSRISRWWKARVTSIPRAKCATCGSKGGITRRRRKNQSRATAETKVLKAGFARGRSPTRTKTIEPRHLLPKPTQSPRRVARTPKQCRQKESSGPGTAKETSGQISARWTRTDYEPAVVADSKCNALDLRAGGCMTNASLLARRENRKGQRFQFGSRRRHNGNRWQWTTCHTRVDRLPQPHCDSGAVNESTIAFDRDGANRGRGEFRNR